MSASSNEVLLRGHDGAVLAIVVDTVADGAGHKLSVGTPWDGSPKKANIE